MSTLSISRTPRSGGTSRPLQPREGLINRIAWACNLLTEQLHPPNPRWDRLPGSKQDHTLGRRSKERHKTEVRPSLNVPSFWIFGGHGGLVADCIFSEVSVERQNVLHLGVFIEPLNR
jgi:hypothetical protein